MSWYESDLSSNHEGVFIGWWGIKFEFLDFFGFLES
jgi:hypothetical protein